MHRCRMHNDRFIELLSPTIGEDSALFDRVTLRLRIVHHRPSRGAIQDAVVQYRIQTHP